MAKRKKKTRVVKEEEEPEEVFQVEVIKRARVSEDGEWEYLVKWAGYDDPSSDTWEPHSGVANCQRLLDAFWREIGHDNDDHFPGDEFEPSQEWIEKEKRWFIRNCKNLQDDDIRKRRLEEERLEAAERAMKQKQKQTRKSSTATLSSITEKKKASTSSKRKVKVEKEKTATTDDSDSDDGQAWPKSITSQFNSIARKRKRVETSESESSSDSDDVPLSALKTSRNGSQVGSIESRGGPSKIKGKGKGKATVASSRASSSTVDKDIDKAPSPAIPKDAAPAPPSRKDSPIIQKESTPSQPAPPKRKPSLPPLLTSNIPTTSTHPPSGTSIAGGSASTLKSVISTTPTLPNINTPTLPGARPGSRVKPLPLPPDVITAGSGLSTKQRLAQGALAPTNPKEKMQSASDSTRTHSAPKAPNLLGNLSFKKKPAPVRASPTITTEDMVPHNLPAYSPQVDSPSIASASTQSGATDSLRPKLSASFSRRKPSDSPKVTASVPPRVASSSSLASQDHFPTLSPAVTSFEPTLSSLNAPPSPIETAGSPMITDLPLTSFSPVEHSNEQSGIGSGIDTFMGPPASMVHNNETEAFLSSIMPPELAAPLRPAEETVDGALRQTPKSSIFIPSRIPKKYKWEGKIVLQSGSGEPETVCEEGVLADVVNAVAERMPFKIAMSYMNGVLELKQFYNLHHLDGILNAYHPAQEFARLRGGNEDDTASLKKLAEFMEAKQLFAVIDVVVEEQCTTRIFVYPTGFGQSNKRLKVRGDLQDSFLVAALFTVVLGPTDIPADWRKSIRERLEEAEDMRDPQVNPKLWKEQRRSRNPSFKHAARILQLQGWLQEYMSVADRPYAIWNGDVLSVTTQIEALLLSALMKQYPQAVDKGLGSEETLKAVFVHVDALKDIGKLPGLGETREHKIETMLILYGSSPDVNPRYWGFREIYPIGGILTFTANALLKNPIELWEMIDHVADHQLWCSYIIPPVLGMAIKLLYKDDDPLKAYDDGKFAFGFLLSAIDKGDIALMYAPPLPHSVVSKNTPRDGKPRDLSAWTQLSESLYEQDPKLHQFKDDTMDWLNAQGDCLLRDPRETLEYCLHEFHSKYANIPESKWHQTLEEEISNDLAVMQIQPELMKNYRRFVVLKAEQDEHITQYRDGFEWKACRSFRFHDLSDDNVKL